VHALFSCVCAFLSANDNMYSDTFETIEFKSSTKQHINKDLQTVRASARVGCRLVDGQLQPASSNCTSPGAPSAESQSSLLLSGEICTTLASSAQALASHWIDIEQAEGSLRPSRTQARNPAVSATRTAQGGNCNQTASTMTSLSTIESHSDPQSTTTKHSTVQGSDINAAPVLEDDETPESSTTNSRSRSSFSGQSVDIAKSADKGSAGRLWKRDKLSFHSIEESPIATKRRQEQFNKTVTAAIGRSKDDITRLHTDSSASSVMPARPPSPIYPPTYAGDLQAASTQMTRRHQQRSKTRSAGPYDVPPRYSAPVVDPLNTGTDPVFVQELVSQVTELNKIVKDLASESSKTRQELWVYEQHAFQREASSEMAQNSTEIQIRQQLGQLRHDLAEARSSQAIAAEELHNSQVAMARIAVEEAVSLVMPKANEPDQRTLAEELRNRNLLLKVEQQLSWQHAMTKRTEEMVEQSQTAMSESLQEASFLRQEATQQQALTAQMAADAAQARSLMMHALEMSSESAVRTGSPGDQEMREAQERFDEDKVERLEALIQESHKQYAIYLAEAHRQHKASLKDAEAEDGRMRQQLKAHYEENLQCVERAHKQMEQDFIARFNAIQNQQESVAQATEARLAAFEAAWTRQANFMMLSQQEVEARAQSGFERLRLQMCEVTEVVQKHAQGLVTHGLVLSTPPPPPPDHGGGIGDMEDGMYTPPGKGMGLTPRTLTEKFQFSFQNVTMPSEVGAASSQHASGTPPTKQVPGRGSGDKDDHSRSPGSPGGDDDDHPSSDGVGDNRKKPKGPGGDKDPDDDPGDGHGSGPPGGNPKKPPDDPGNDPSGSPQKNKEKDDNNRRQIKEKTSFTFDWLPKDASQLKSFRTEINAEYCAVAGTTVITAWVMEAFDLEVDAAEVESVNEHESVDLRAYSTLSALLRKHYPLLASEVQEKQDALLLARPSKTLSSRYIIRRLVTRFELDANKASVHAISDFNSLPGLEFTKDEKTLCDRIDQYLMQLDLKSAKLKGAMLESVATVMMQEKLEEQLKQKSFAEADTFKVFMPEYLRSTKKAEVYCYAWLRRNLEDFVQDRRKEHAREAELKAVSKKATATPATAEDATAQIKRQVEAAVAKALAAKKSADPLAPGATSSSTVPASPATPDPKKVEKKGIACIPFYEGKCMKKDDKCRFLHTKDRHEYNKAVKLRDDAKAKKDKEAKGKENERGRSSSPRAPSAGNTPRGKANSRGSSHSSQRSHESVEGAKRRIVDKNGKTVCKFHRENKCSKGASCSFSHEEGVSVMTVQTLAAAAARKPKGPKPCYMLAVMAVLNFVLFVLNNLSSLRELPAKQHVANVLRFAHIASQFFQLHNSNNSYLCQLASEGASAPAEDECCHRIGDDAQGANFDIDKTECKALPVIISAARARCSLLRSSSEACLARVTFNDEPHECRTGVENATLNVPTKRTRKFNKCWSSTDEVITHLKDIAKRRQRIIRSAIQTAEQLEQECEQIYNEHPVAVLVLTSYIADTGAGVHLRKWTPELQNASHPAQRLDLTTANGKLESESAVFKPVEGLGEIEFRILKSTPNVLSVGRLIREKKMTFYWTYDQEPYFILPTGQQIKLEVRNDVPIFKESKVKEIMDSLIACPAPSRRLRLKTPDPGFIPDDKLDDKEGDKEHEEEESELIIEQQKQVKHQVLHLGQCKGVCPICRVAKQRRHRASTVKSDKGEYAKKFAEKTSYDTFEPGLREFSSGVGGFKNALCTLDEASGFITFTPTKSKSASAVMDGLMEHLGSDVKKAGLFYSDGDRAFQKAARLLRIPLRKATPRTPVTNSRHERHMEIIGDGIRTLLYQSGLTLAFWPLAGVFFAQAWNLLRINPRTGKTAYEFRYPSAEPPDIMPFGCRCTYVPPKTTVVKGKDVENMDKVSPRGVEAIFLGPYCPPGGLLTKEYLVSPLASFLTPSSAGKIVRTRDVRFHEIEFPIRNMRLKQQQELYNQTHTPLTEEQYQDLIFGSQGESTKDTSTKILDPDEGKELEFEDDDLGEELTEEEINKIQAIELAEDDEEEQGQEPGKPSDSQLSETSASGQVPPSADKEAERMLKSYDFFARSNAERKAKQAIPSIVEFACSPQSELGNEALLKGISSLRLTEQFADLSELDGLNKAKHHVARMPKPVHLHGSLPCTPWTQWAYMNLSRLGREFQERLMCERSKSRQMLVNFVDIASQVIRSGGTISFEWPRYCAGWDLPELHDMINRFNLIPADIDGCMVGVVSKKDETPIKKPWRFVCSDPQLAESLGQYICDKEHNHVPCQGGDTKQTGFYPRKLAEIMIEAIFKGERKTCYVIGNDVEDLDSAQSIAAVSQAQAPELAIVKDLNRQVNKAINRAQAKLNKIKQKPKTQEKEQAPVQSYYVWPGEDEAILTKQQVLNCHRQKLGAMPLGLMGAVVKVLKRSDPLWKTPEAAGALLKESTKLMNAGVWDIVPEEKDDVIRKFPDASFSRLFDILGLKNSESSSPVYKARIVVQGSNVRDASGESVYFSDTASAPTNMVAIRSVVAFGELTNGGSSCADAEQAYIQPRLPEEIALYVVIPDTLMTETMKAQARKLRCPVFRLRRPLYGWSRSGNIWEKHLADTLTNLDLQTEYELQQSINKLQTQTKWKPVENWPQTFWKRNKYGHINMLTVYVDDFVMSGIKHEEEWESIRKVVTTTTPAQVGRVLGVYYNFAKGDGQRREIVMDMVDYSKQALEMYHSVPNAPPLRKGVYYPWYEPTMDEIQNLTSQKGVFQEHAASLLMKLLYQARMVRLDMCYAINALSRYVTRWNKLCDKQIVHLFSYLDQTQGSSLHAFVVPQDINEIELHAFPDADLAGTFDTTKATSGGFVHIHGPGTFFPLDWYSKRQTATAHSTTEAELISASKMLREALIPIMELWSLMLDRPIKGIIHEDNMSTITVIETGYSPQMRHLQKHHRISLGLVHELVQNPDIVLRHTSSETQKGDLMTKGLARPKHEPACRLVGLYPFLVSYDPDLFSCVAVAA